MAGLWVILPFALGALLAGIWANDRHPMGGRIIGDPVEYAAVLLAGASFMLALWPLMKGRSETP